MTSGLPCTDAQTQSFRGGILWEASASRPLEANGRHVVLYGKGNTVENGQRFASTPTGCRCLCRFHDVPAKGSKGPMEVAAAAAGCGTCGASGRNHCCRRRRLRGAIVLDQEVEYEGDNCLGVCSALDGSELIVVDTGCICAAATFITTACKRAAIEHLGCSEILARGVERNERSEEHFRGSLLFCGITAVATCSTVHSVTWLIKTKWHSLLCHVQCTAGTLGNHLPLSRP